MAELLSQGVELMIAGMLVVYALLILLVFAVKGTSRLALWIDAAAGTPGASPGPGAPVDDSYLVAAVTAAVHAYRKDAERS